MAAVLLEIFDAPAAEPDVPSGPSEDWLDGHAAGVAAARDDASAEAARHAADLVAALADMEFTLAEARQEVLAGLAPLFRAILSQLLPALAGRATVDRALAMLTEAAEDALDPPAALSVHPDDRAALAGALAERSSPAVELVGDARLGRGEVVLTRRDSERAIDLGRLLSELTDLLDHLARPDPAQKDSRHG